MFKDVTEFRWKRPLQGGFFWQPHAHGELVLKKQPDTSLVVYSPLREPVAFYYELAGIDLTPEGALVFANRYGMLAGPTVENRLYRSRTEAESYESLELYHHWVQAVAYLREALRILMLFRRGNKEGLKEFFRWENGGVDYVPSTKFRADLGADTRAESRRFSTGESRYFDILGTRRQGLDSPEPAGDVLRAAITVVTGLISFHLMGNAGPQISWDPSTNKVIYSDAPFSLFGAVWLQLAHAVHSEKIAKQCRTCGRWFEVAGGRKSGSKRTDREFCSNSCRTKNYLQRQEEARRRHARGETAAKIAKDLGTTASIVKNWLRKKGN